MPIAPQFNRQRNAITNALMNVANPPPRRPPMPQLAGPMQQPSAIGPQMAPPGTLPQGMPPPPQGMPTGAFPTPPTAPTPGSPLTPMAGPKGVAPQQGMMPQQPIGQTGQGTI